jgi:hypothetical protein
VQYLAPFNIFEGQELVGGAEFVLTGGRIAVAEFQLNTLPGGTISTTSCGPSPLAEPGLTPERADFNP